MTFNSKQSAKELTPQFIMSENVSFGRWMRMKPVVRQTIIDEEEDLLENIAPELRVPNPGEVENYQQIQHEYEIVYRTSPVSSTSSLVGDIRRELINARQYLSTQITEAIQEHINTRLDTQSEIIHQLREAIDERNERFHHLERELEELRMNQSINSSERLYHLERELEELRMNQSMDPSSDIMRISGQSRMFDQILEPYGQVMIPRYDVFRVIDDYNHTLYRFFLQPFHHENYEEVILHFINRDVSPVARLLEGAYVSLTFHCFMDRVQRNFTFREYPGSGRSLMDYIEEVYEDAYGSDIIRNIRHNIMAVSVNIVRAYAGGILRSSDNKVMHLELFDPKSRYYNSCFYACIREISKVTKNNKVRHVTYERMRIMLTKSPEDREVGINKIKDAEELFGVKLIVLGEQLPKVSYIKRAKKHSLYKDLKIIYSIEYDTLYYKGFTLKLVERSDDKISFNRIGNITYIDIDGEKYYLLCLHNNHYSIVRTVIRPVTCEKCGSDKHNVEQVLNNIGDKLECLENVQNILTRNEYKKELPTPTLVFFDIETINVNGILQAYSVFWRYKDSQIKLNESSIYEENSIHEGFLTGYKCEEKFVSTIQKIKGVKILIGYNSSRFDNYFIMKSLIKMGVHLDNKNCIIHKNQILRLNLKTLKTWDLCQFTKCSLNDVCEAYGIKDRKIDYNHENVQKTYNVYKWKFLEIIGIDRIKQYNRQDVLLLEKIFYMIHKELYDITNIDPLTTMTLSQLAYKHMLAENREQGIEINKVPIDYDHIFSSLPAGRVQMWKTGKLCRTKYVQVDVNGLYVHICLSNMFPNGEVQYLENFDKNKVKNKLYMCECKVDQTQARIKLCGVKEKGKRISWTENIVCVWLWNEEIDELENDPNCHVLHKGKTLLWPEKINPFTNMQIYKKIRMEEKQKIFPNKVRDNNAKALGNSTTGKTIQKNKNEEWTIVSNLAEAELFKQRYNDISFDVTDIPNKYIMMGKSDENPFINKPRHIGCRIYALARLYMYNHMKQLDEIDYLDTDGFIIPKPPELKLYKIPLSNNFGQFKIEAEGDIVYLVSLKNYCIHNSTNLKSKFRLKGYKEGDPWYVLDKNNQQVYRYDKINVKMYEFLVNKEEYRVMTSVKKIIKKFVKKDPIFHSNSEYSVPTYKISTLHLQCEERLIV